MRKLISGFILMAFVLAGCTSENPADNNRNTSDADANVRETNPKSTNQNGKNATETNSEHDRADAGSSDEKQKESFPTISTGEKVDVSTHLVRGKYNVIKFTADW